MKKLKRGIALYPSSRSDGYLCGTPHRLIPISPADHQELLALALGGSDTHDPTRTTAATNKETLVEKLEEAGFLDHEIGKVSLTGRYSAQAELTDAAYVQMRARITPELSHTTWLPGADDGGVAHLTARQNLLIEISGKNRVATLLLSLLLSSGFTHTRISADTKSAHPLIEDSDIGLAGISPSDIGASIHKRELQLRRDISLFPLDKSFDYSDERSTPDLIVRCGDIDPHYLATWMARGQKFLHIPLPIADTAQIGPLVFPGKSPCIRCAQLQQEELTGIRGKNLLQNSQSNDDYPVIAAHYVAAIAATFITQWCSAPDEIKEVAGKIIFYHYQSPATSREVAIARHPLCGCTFQ